MTTLEVITPEETVDPMSIALHEISLMLQQLDSSIIVSPIDTRKTVLDVTSIVEQWDLQDKYYWLDYIFRYSMGLADDPELENNLLLAYATLTHSSKALLMIELYKRTTQLFNSFMLFYELWLSRYIPLGKDPIQDFKDFREQMLAQAKRENDQSKIDSLTKMCTYWDGLFNMATVTNIFNVREVKCWICNYIRSRTGGATM